jgi:hypothetical protein
MSRGARSVSTKPSVSDWPERKALPALSPGGRATVVATAKLEGRGQRLRGGCGEHGGRCLINSALMAGSSNEHEIFLHFHTYENPYIRLYKNTCEEARELGQIADACIPVEQGERPDAVASSLRLLWATIYKVLR